jgi:hypothetical protein
MEDILPALQQYEFVIYALLGMVALIYIQKLVSAWREWRGTVFGIERDIALRRFQSTLTVLIIVILFAFTEFFIVTFVAPAYPQTALLATPTLDLLATPTITLSAQVGALVSTRTPAVPTPEPTSQPEGCVPGMVEWVSPQPGEEISATVRLVGTVNVPNLGFFKYEFAEPESDVWNTIAANNEPKVNGEFGFWNTSQLEPKEYLLRLVVLDNQNQSLPVCVIRVRVMPSQ